jgi:hypothetical protein
VQHLRSKWQLIDLQTQALYILKKDTMSFKTFTVIACLSFSSLHAQQNASAKYGDNPKAGGFYNHGGVKVYYEIYGQGKPMVLLHGNGGSIGSRAKLIPDFAKHYQVIAFDSRCHGKTDCPRGYLTYEKWPRI